MYSITWQTEELKPLIAGDTAIITYSVPLSNFPGNNELKLEVNPENDQPEQFLFNNILYKQLYVTDLHCSGDDITFNAAAFSGNMQWQADTGAGFANISDGAQYTGTNTNSLTIMSPASNMTGYKYRCVYTGSLHQYF